MEDQQPVKQIPCEQTSMVAALIRESGISQNVISRKSGPVAEEYRELCPDLPGPLSPSTISRMRTGSDLQKLKRFNLVLLYLTVRYAEAATRGVSAASRPTLEEACSFADSVLAAGSAPKEQPTAYDPNDPRHDRTVDLFDDYGISLLEAAIARNEASSFRKLAVLQWLSGNTDDARYWNQGAGDAAAEQPLALDNGIAAREAFAVGRKYLLNGNRPVAEIYLDLAAHTGHADAAFLLGEVLEASQHIEEARRWFSTAETNGHSEAGKRLSALEAR